MKSRRNPGPATLEGYYRRIGAAQLAPLWERLTELLPPEPRVRSRPFLWHYEALRPMLLESAEFITEEQAERRVLILENPGLLGESAITESLFAGLQVMMPGEVAAPHRHSPAALRFILESDSAYTSVDDERIEMHPGDVILTPSWSWHGHGSYGLSPVIWLDVLDLPTVRAFGPGFAERWRTAESESGFRADDLHRSAVSPAAVGAPPELPLCFPYSQVREALEHLKRSSEPDLTHGLKIEYGGPANGEGVLPSISAFLQLFPAGFRSATNLTTEGIVYCVAEGRGRVFIDSTEGGQYFDYSSKDVFAMPCWIPHSFEAAAESVLFSASDRAAQVRLGLWRAGPDAGPDG
jgi:gentisate 1,2-dioxygenase